MKWKQALVLIALAVSGNVLAQDAKTPSAVKVEKKQPNVSVQVQPASGSKAAAKKSFNPDLPPEFLSAPAQVKDKSRP